MKAPESTALIVYRPPAPLVRFPFVTYGWPPSGPTATVHHASGVKLLMLAPYEGMHITTSARAGGLPNTATEHLESRRA